MFVAFGFVLGWACAAMVGQPEWLRIVLLVVGGTQLVVAAWPSNAR